MKLLILHRYPLDLVVGTNPSFPSMLECLNKKAVQIIFLSFKGGTPNRFHAGEFVELKWNFNRSNPTDKILKTILWIIFVPFLVKKIAQKKNIDVIYCDDSIPFYPFVVKILVGKKIKVIMRLGDLQTGYLFADQGFIKKCLYICFHAIEKYIWKTIDGIICISEPFKKYLEQEQVNPKSLTVVKESIDVDFFRPQISGIRSKYNIGNDNTLIMFHGAIEKCKGVEVLVEAAKQLVLKYKEVYFMIIGDGSDFKKVQDAIERAELQQRCILTGWVDFKEMPDYINAADIGIALRNSNMANHFVVTTALLQYWACEKPLLAPNLVAMQEVVVDGENAVIFEAGNASDLVKKIEFMLEMKDKWNDLGRAGRNTVQQHFEKSKIGHEMANILIQYASSQL